MRILASQRPATLHTASGHRSFTLTNLEKAASFRQLISTSKGAMADQTLQRGGPLAGLLARREIRWMLEQFTVQFMMLDATYACLYANRMMEPK